jgi:hypothetical protein
MFSFLALVAVALIAAWIPARKTARVDPIISSRCVIALEASSDDEGPLCPRHSATVI